ncbi:50S ribosomal protein L37ae [Nanoarchaeota archaeon]
MAKKVKLGSTKRYGPRYGRRNKDKVASLEKEHRGRHKCPYCAYVKVVRLAKGIWACQKCGAKFAGKAYTYDQVKRSIAPEEKKMIEPTEELEEQQEEDLDEEQPEEEEEKPAEEPEAEPEDAPTEEEQPEAEPEEPKEELSEKAEVA